MLHSKLRPDARVKQILGCVGGGIAALSRLGIGLAQCGVFRPETGITSLWHRYGLSLREGRWDD
jgi:hypothetical protein